MKTSKDLIIGDFVKYRLHFESDAPGSYINFIIYKVESWDGNNTPNDLDRFMEGFMKWDGCAEITFGGNGTIHFCHRYQWEEVRCVMDLLYSECKSILKEHENEY